MSGLGMNSMGGYGMGGYGMGGYGMGGYGMGGYGMGGYGMGGYGMGGYGTGGYGTGFSSSYPSTPATTQAALGGTSATGSTDQTGSYLSPGASGAAPASRVPRVIPNSFDNSLLIQATPQDYQQILKLLDQIDVPPRQVLIEARIYEVNMQGEFAAGVQSYLQNKNASLPSGISGRQLVASATTASNLTMTAGLLVGNSRQLLGILTANQSNNRAKLISAPSIIATDSIAATINVGDSVPTLSGSLTSSISTTSVATAYQNVQTGVTMNVIARVTPSGIITMKIDQQVSSPVAPKADATIQTPSFQNRTVSTQVTVQDGDTIAIGGIILDTDTLSSSGIPLLHRIPGIGAAFGSKSVSKARTEMVIFFTPRVIYDTNQITDASDEIKSKFKKLRPMIQE
jgi:general secretion pathway protein D